MKQLLILLLSIPFILPVSAQPNISKDLLKKHVYFLAADSLKGRGFGSPEGKIAANYIAENFRSASIEPLNDSYFYFFNARFSIVNIDGMNVLGLIEGNDPELKKEYIVLGAHFDHLGWKLKDGDTIAYNGADDNASGVSSIIEIGRYLSANRDKLKRSVIIAAFDGEETGLNGSTHFITDSVVPIKQIKAMFSLDMVGMYAKNGGLDLDGLKLLTDGTGLVEKIMEDHPLEIKKTGDNIPRNTDTAPFGKAGIPSIHAFTGLKSPYHKPEDDRELLDYDGMVKICDFFGALTLEMSTEPELLASSSLTEPAEKKTSKILYPGLRLNTGSSRHIYAEEFYNGKSVFSTSAGAFLQIRLNQYLSLQPEVLYEWKGSNHDQGILRMHSMSTPICLLVTTPDTEDYGVRAFLQMGGFYSYNFSGKLDGNDLDFDAGYERQEAGLVLGIGMELKKIRVGFQYKRELTNLIQDDNQGKIIQEGTFFSIGYAF